MSSKKRFKCRKNGIRKVDVLLDILLKEIFYFFIGILLEGMAHRNLTNLLEILYSL